MESAKTDKAQDKALIKKAFREHDAQEHKGGSGTVLKLSRGGGMAKKGVNPFAKFEKSGKDVEVKGKGKEGSKKEKAFDKKQMGMAKYAKGGGIEARGKTRGKIC